MARRKKFHYEESVQELETLVQQLEQGDLELEDALKQFERGVELTRLCQQALDEAEQKVSVLSTQGQQQEEQLIPFDAED
ncbi:exodeoxyribonuclease VII small subunit [Pelagibaculum spongiae]|uniref:Exodeoxyribonuclease 7 small subunit n=1 Tax=Pelagibaculum spongiae TaxID=2080658 RepID=A0A2V1GWE5_9GAMM|nr:exodeoxyribonuclease VII small subunit [Pelagibaculum spongiae]PVZ71501.1 exodeoxyribonuclease VII small subunit [Pelagibaculum spongiae]